MWIKKIRLTTAGSIGIIIFISRIFGFIRDLCIAAFIGAGPINDAFLAAFKLTNLFRTIFGEGAMSSALVPTISQSLTSHGEKYARVLKCHILTIVLLILIISTFIIYLYIRNIILFTNPGFKTQPIIFDLAVDLAYITFPCLIFISLAAFYGAALQTKSIFIPYTATSILFNLVLITSCYLCSFFNCFSMVHALSYGVLIGGMLELLWMMFCANKYNIKLHLRRPVMSKYLRVTLKRIIPCIISSGISQISVWCDMIILSFFASGISYLYFADRLVQLPLALFSTASAIILLPFLSRSNKAEKITAFSNAFSSTLFFIMPCAIGLHIIAEELIINLFVRGEFSRDAAYNTAIILKILCFALPFQAISKIYISALHSSGQTSISMYIAIISLIVNIALSIMFIGTLQNACVAVASVFSSAVQCILLVYKTTEIHITTVAKKDSIKCIIGAIIMGWLIIAIKSFLKEQDNIISIIIYIFIGMLTYIMLLLIMRVQLIKKFLPT